MGKRTFPGLVVRFGVAILALPAIAVQTADPVAARRIFVVAVQDSSLFTLCPASLPEDPWSQPPGPVNSGQNARLSSDGRVVLMGLSSTPLSLPAHVLPRNLPILDRPHPDWLELAHTAPGVSPSGWVDGDLQKRIETEFRKRKDRVLVDDPRNADLVFLVEGLYFPGVLISGGVRIGHALQAVVALAVPAEAYGRFPEDSQALLKASIWQGVSIWQSSRRPASAEELVGQFLRQKKWPDDVPPLCTAWSLLPPSGSAPGASSTAPKPGESGQPLPPERKAGDPVASHAIRVDVAIVTVPVIASDADGRFVPGLTQDRFRLFENGREQQIDRVIPETAPFHVALLLDVSNSTNLKHTEIQAAALGFVDALRPDDQVMVISFGSLVFLDSEFTNDRRQLRDAIMQTRVFGGTRLYDAVDLAVTERLDRVRGRKAIVIFTDGVDSLSRLATSASTLARVEESDVLVNVIQYDTKKDMRGMMANPDQEYARGTQYLLDLSGSSGGRLFGAATAPSLRNAFDRVAEELRHQYTICYYPDSPAGDGSFRAISVLIDRPGIRIRARRGYRPAAK